MRWLLLLLLLASCGGGGGDSQPSAPAAPLPKRQIDFTFFGQSDPAVTAPFTSVYFAIDWGDWTKPDDIANRIIAELQAAKARGIKKFIVSTGFLTLTADCRYVGTLALAQFKRRLDALGLDVWMLYPMDEPDIHGCSDATLTQAYNESRATWGNDVRIGVIYSDHGTPGINAATDIGHDDYSHGPQIVSIRADQHLILVPGGADPWKENPAAYIAAAEANPQVSLVMAFLWVDYAGGKGISDNGELAVYKAAGCSLTMQC